MNNVLLHKNIVSNEPSKKCSNPVIVNNTKGAVSKILDWTKTAPFWLVSGGVFSLIILWILVGLNEMDLYIKLVAIAPHVGCLWLSINAMRIQFKLRRRLEKIVRKRGYKDEIFVKAVNEWCDIKTARIVAENCWHLPEFDALCERHKDEIWF